ncbi:hypothetical protein TNCV_999261 [Trichonephila clavipes]|nr:hypothetical protein TNCV_999261 [Trichonephila clavipes]
MKPCLMQMRLNGIKDFQREGILWKTRNVLGVQGGNNGVNVDIIGNEQADNLAKETQNSPQLSNSLVLFDTDTIPRRKLNSHPVKEHFIPDLNCNLEAARAAGFSKFEYFINEELDDAASVSNFTEAERQELILRKKN